MSNYNLPSETQQAIQDYSNTFNDLNHREGIDALFQFYVSHPELNPQEQLRATALISETLVQSIPDEGLYGVAVGESNLPITNIIASYLFLSGKQKNNLIEPGEDYFDAIARMHKISRDAAEASLFFYYKYKSSYDAFFTYNAARKHKDSDIQESK